MEVGNILTRNGYLFWQIAEGVTEHDHVLSKNSFKNVSPMNTAWKYLSAITRLEISKNWAGHPLESFEVLLHFVRNTKTESGLRIEAYLDEKEYEKGVKVSDKEFRALNINKNIKLGNWNYSIAPTQFSEEIFLNSRRGNMQESLEINDEWVKADRECSATSDCTIPAM